MRGRPRTQASRRAEETSPSSGAGEDRDQSAPRQAGRTKGRLATCISTDSVMLCRRLGAAGLYGNPQERKGPGSRQGGGGRGREGALARPRAPGGAGRGLGAPGTAEAAEEAPAPFPPPPFPPALLEGLCGRDPEAPGFSSAGWGRARQPLVLQGKPKVPLFAPLQHAAAPGRVLGEPRFAAHPPAPTKISLRHLARCGGGRGVWRRRGRRGE